MKKKIILFSFLFISFLSKGQSLINENFENWVDNTAFIDPEGWISINDLNPEYGLPFTVFKSTEAKEGKFAAQLKSATYKNFEDKVDTIASILVYGTNVNSGITYPFTQRLKTISFYYKYKPNGIDTGVMYLSVGYRDKKANKIVYHSGAYFVFAKKELNFTKVVLPLYYSTNHKCDTFVFAFINSVKKMNGNRNKPGTELLIDDIDTEWEIFPPVTLIKEIDLEIGVYPNPATDKIYFKGLTQQNYTYTLRDNTGKVIVNEPLFDEQIDVGSLKTGLYHVSLLSNEGFIGATYFLKK